MKRCQSCGRLIELLEDFAGLDQSSIYCSSCADDSGKLMSFEEVLENLTQRIAKTDGFDEQASRNAALQILGRQPAWEPKFMREEGMKTNKKRLLMITVAAIFAITAGGVTWWLTSRYYQNRSNYYELHIANYDDPFKDIKVEKKDAFTVSEFRCKGDQELSKIEDGLLQFKSYEDLGVLPFDENLVSDQLKDYSSYIVNLESMQSVNLEKITYGYSKAERDKLDKLVNGKKDVIEWQSPRSMINIVAGYPELRKKQANAPKQDLFISYNLFKHIRYSIKQRKFLNYEDLRFFSCMSTNLEYRYKDKTLESFNEFDAQKYGLNNYVYIFQGEEFPELKTKYLIKGFFTGVLKTKGSKALMRFSTSRPLHTSGSGFVKLLIVDMEKETFTQLDYPKIKDVYENVADEMESLSLDGIYKIEQLIDGKKMGKYYQYDAFENKTKELGTFPQGLSLMSYKETDRGYQLYFKKEDDKNKNKMELLKYSSLDGKIETFYSGSNMNVFENVGNWVFASKYTEKKSKYTNNAGENPPIMELYAINIHTGKQTLLCDDFNDSYQNFLTDGNYIAWTKMCYEFDNQWKNVCFAKIP